MDEDEKSDVDESYHEARTQISHALGNFGYGLHRVSLQGFMDEMAIYFHGPAARITRSDFLEAASKAWNKAIVAAGGAPHYPPGMGDESRRLHREYICLVEAQRNGAQNGPEVVKLTDECNAKGIILVPGGENL